MSSILITGGAGYIGSHTLIELLQNTPHEVLSIDNFSNSGKETYERVRRITGKPFKTIDVDLCDRAALEKALAPHTDIKGIIHFAAFKSVPDSMADPLSYYHNNNEALVNVLRFARDQRVPHFIFSSSCSVYGNADELPVTERTPLKRAESPYGHTKQMGEEIIDFFCNAHPEVKTVILRYFNPVGAHMSGENGEVPIGRPNNLVPIITQTALGLNTLTVFGNDYPTRDGYCIRDYVHVSDIARAHVDALNYLDAGKQSQTISLFNLGTGNGVSVKEVIASFEKVTGRKLPYKVGPRREGDVIAVYCDNTAARTQLGWKPQHNLDDMMTSAWKWQQRLIEKS